MLEVSCRITAAFLTYIKNTRQEFLGPLLMGLPYDEVYLSNPDHWIPLDVERIMEDRLVELFHDERILFHIGRSVVSLKSLGIVNIIFNLFVTPERLIRYAPKIARYFTKDIVQIAVRETTRNSALVEVAVRGRQTRGACLFNQGLFSLASELFGQGETRVEEVQCVVPVHELGRHSKKSYAIDESNKVIESSCCDGHQVVGMLSEKGTFTLNNTLFGAESCVYRLTWDRKPFKLRRGTAGRKEALEEALLHLEENYGKLQKTYDSLWKSEEKYRDLMENASDIICFLDAEGRIMALNKKGVELIGYALDEVLKKDVLSFVDEPGRDAAAARLKESLAGNPAVVEVTLKTKHGDPLILSVNSTPVMEDGRITGIMLIARDITGEREMAGRLIEAERFAAKGMIAAEIAHEINNSLANIETALYILNNMRVDRAYRQDVLKDVREEIDRMSGIVKGILEVYRADDSVIQTVDINAEIVRVILIMQRRLNGRGIAITPELYPNLSPVPCYPGHIKQVLLNLIKNAEEAMLSSHKKVILVSTEEREDLVSMKVSDTGSGISPEGMKQIFTPFHTSKPEGAGIGLTICREIIKRYGGDIQIQSEEGKGTCVTVSFPKHFHG
jgi:PAS domain S-box-containing protein